MTDLFFTASLPVSLIQGGDRKELGTGGRGITSRASLRITALRRTIFPINAGCCPWRARKCPDSAGSQFFVMHGDGEYLDGEYAAFGKVIEGMETVDAIAAVKTDWNDRPYEEQKLKTVTAETFGAEYPEPSKA